MLEMGPAARGLVESAAVVQMARDPLEATLLLKRLASGLQLADLAPPDAREEIEALLTAIRSRAGAMFLAWAESRDMPDAEMRAGLDAFERCTASELDAVLRALTPAASPRETLETAMRRAADRAGIMRDDLIARDIGWALIRSALTAAEVYAEPLRNLAPPPPPR